MMTQLTDEQRRAVDQHHGFLEVEGGGAVYVIMSMQVFWEMMGVGSDAEYRASVEAIQEGLADVEAGQPRPIADFFDDLDRKHRVSRESAVRSPALRRRSHQRTA